MQRSLFERIFPHPRDSVNYYYNKDGAGDSILPLHEYSDDPSRRPSDEPPRRPAPSAAFSSSSRPRVPRIVLRESPSEAPRSPVSSPSVQSSQSPNRRRRHDGVSQSSQYLQSQRQLPLLNKSVISHDDPFLGVERAAKALQATIQSFIDAQSDGLNAVLDPSASREGEDISSAGSLTPTPSTTNTPSSRPLHASNTTLKTVPVRQPKAKKITLRKARMGLGRSMEQFVGLKAQELQLLQEQIHTRELAIEQVQALEKEEETLHTQIRSIEAGKNSSRAATLREEAKKVGLEIIELETRLQELRLRHHQLSSQSEQLDNSLESKLSSYRSSLALVDREVRQFLRQPPVSHSLSFGKAESGVDHGRGMYELRPERRSLKMAQDQWSTEIDILAERTADLETEQKALAEGSKIWREAVTKIDGFEKNLRSFFKAMTDSQVKSPARSPARSPLAPSDHQTVHQLNEVITFLETKLAEAESQKWNLLICCLGAELEALMQARTLLKGDQEPSQEEPDPWDDPPASESGADFDQTFSKHRHLEYNRVQHSNSVNDHLVDDGVGQVDHSSKGKERHDTVNPVMVDEQSAPDLFHSFKRQPDSRSESEDDDPGPDFLISHA